MVLLHKDIDLFRGEMVAQGGGGWNRGRSVGHLWAWGYFFGELVGGGVDVF